MLYHNLGVLECPLRQQTSGDSPTAECLSRVLANPALPWPPLPSPLPVTAVPVCTTPPGTV